MYFILIFVLILAECNTEESQTLVCQYEPQYALLERVWCKKDSEECCTGFAFGKRITSIDNGSIEITNDTQTAFTVTVQNLNQGDGVYWCGLMFKNQTIIKLAEKYFSAGTAKKEKIEEDAYAEIPMNARDNKGPADDAVTEE